MYCLKCGAVFVPTSIGGCSVCGVNPQELQYQFDNRTAANDKQDRIISLLESILEELKIHR